MAEGMGDHAVREECIPRAPSRRLFKSRTSVRFLLLLTPQPADVNTLRAEIRPTTTSSRTFVRWIPHRQRRSVPHSTQSQLRSPTQPYSTLTRSSSSKQSSPHRPTRSLRSSGYSSVAGWTTCMPGNTRTRTLRGNSVRVCVVSHLLSTRGSDVVQSKKGLDAAQLERKIRLLALADLGFQNIGQDLPYAQVATSLQVPTTQVERWVIDGK